MVPNRPPVHKPKDRPADQSVPPDDELGPIEFSDELGAELLDPEVWGDALETYAATTRLAVALTDTQGRLLGVCHNGQPVWRMIKAATRQFEAACPFCLSPPSPCRAVADALRTGGMVIARDGAGLAHVAVPLTLGGRRWGALIAGQVFCQYPEPLPLQRVARDYGLSPQEVWHTATKQVPVKQTNLEVFAHLLMLLGDAYLGQRYVDILQKKLAATNLRYRLLIDGVKDYGMFTTDRGGKITSWNSGAASLFGYTEAEIVGQDGACLFIPEDVRKGLVEQSLQEVDRKGWIESEGWQIRKNETRFYASGVLASLGHGPQREYGMLIRDVTELRRSEEAVRQAQKLESIGVLAGGIAHDFNNLLTGIKGGVSFAKDSLPPEHPAYPMLEIAEQSSERAAELTAQLLAYAGKGKFVITRFDLSRLVAEMLPLIEASISKAVQLELLLTPGLPWIEGDATQIRQIVMNLIINGAEAIGERGGTVRVSTGTSGDDVYLEVKDSGAGMSEATKAKIFDPFFTTKSGGRGLGLAAVSGILRGHKGRMEVQSVPGEGTTFTVFLPSVEPKARVVVNARPSTVTQVVTQVVTQAGTPLATQVKHGGGTILFVDDEPALRSLGTLVLEHAGYTVLVAKNGREAVDVFKQNASRIRAVLLDMNMPVMGGREAFRLIRQSHPEVPVIFMTGFNEDVTRADLGEGAVVNFIQKPYSSAKLVAAIQASRNNPRTDNPATDRPPTDSPAEG